MDAPCKDCKDRTLHCHSKCEKYLKFRQERDKALVTEYALKESQNYRSAETEKTMRRRQRRR
jgi:hypothetical protein